MTHNILVVMSLSGSVVLLLYALSYPLTKRFCSLACNYWMLKIAIIFYLFPFPWFKYHIASKMYDVLLQFKKYQKGAEYTQMDMEYLIINHGGLQYISLGIKRMRILVIGLCIVALIIFALHLFQYLKMRKLCLDNMEGLVNPEHWRIFEELKRELKIRTKIRLISSGYCNMPITTGLLPSMIILPTWVENVPEHIFHDIVMHELIHIKHRDLLVKFLGGLVIALHWCNPCSYILYYEISNISEMYCDSAVLKNRGKEERRAYGELLLKFVTECERVDWYFMAGILGNGGMKRRILEMKTDRKNKIVVSIAVLLLICMAGQATVLAYEVPTRIDGEEREKIVVKDTEIYFMEEEFEIDDIFYDNYFVDADDNVYEVKDREAKVLCPHRYESGTNAVHTKKSNGGCIVTFYKAKRCANCGYVVRGEKIETRSYVKCPH